MAQWKNRITGTGMVDPTTGMEISPQYCEVICQRWEKLTGQTRQKLSEVSTE